MGPRLHLPELDGLRGIAVLMVMLYHLRKLVHFETPGHLSSYGWAGVDLFFVLSGFLITGILLDSKASNSYFRNFYARRILRIWPLYFALLALVFLGAGAANPNVKSELARYSPWVYVFFLQNLVYWSGGFYLLIQTWSLAIEEQFYVAWPLLVRLTSTKTLTRICLGLMVGAPLLRAGLLRWGFSPEVIYHGTFTHIDGIATGALLATQIRECRPEVLLRRTTIAGAAGFVAFVALAIVTGTGIDVTPLAYTTLSLMFAALVFWAVAPQSSWTSLYKRALRIGWLRYTGKISYALYLSHSALYPMFAGLRTHHRLPKFSNPWLDDIFVSCVCLGVSYAVSSASWYLFESPILRFKSYFEQAPAASPEPSAPGPREEQSLPIAEGLTPST